MCVCSPGRRKRKRGEQQQQQPDQDSGLGSSCSVSLPSRRHESDPASARSGAKKKKPGSWIQCCESGSGLDPELFPGYGSGVISIESGSRQKSWIRTFYSGIKYSRSTTLREFVSVSDLPYFFLKLILLSLDLQAVYPTRSLLTPAQSPAIPQV